MTSTLKGGGAGAATTVQAARPITPSPAANTPAALERNERCIIMLNCSTLRWDKFDPAMWRSCVGLFCPAALSGEDAIRS